MAQETVDEAWVADTPSEELSALNTPAGMTPIEEYPVEQED